MIFVNKPGGGDSETHRIQRSYVNIKDQWKRPDSLQVANRCLQTRKPSVSNGHTLHQMQCSAGWIFIGLAATTLLLITVALILAKEGLAFRGKEFTKPKTMGETECPWGFYEQGRMCLPCQRGSMEPICLNRLRIRHLGRRLSY